MGMKPVSRVIWIGSRMYVMRFQDTSSLILGKHPKAMAECMLQHAEGPRFNLVHLQMKVLWKQVMQKNSSIKPWK